MRRSRWWHLVEEDDGLGLIEVMVSIFILGVALLALASVATSSLVSMRITRDREQAINAASAAIEDARSRDFNGMVLAPGSVSVAAIPPGEVPAGSSNTCFGSEPVNSDGAVIDPVPFVRTAGNDDRITVYTIISYVQETPVAANCAGASATDLKRVTVIASWRDGDVVRSVTQETQVAAASRGLPVPRFEVRPSTASLRFSHEFLETASDRTRCIEHQLRNLGAEDSYDWELTETSLPGTIGILGSAEGFRVPSNWAVRAYLQYPANPADDPSIPPSDGLMTGAGPIRPFSEERIEPGDSATLTVCYTDESAGGTWPGDMVATISIFSRFDERQVRTVEHHISVTDESVGGPGDLGGEPFYLFDWDDTKSHARTQPKPTNPNINDPVLLPLHMGPKAGPETPAEHHSHLGTIDYTDPAKSNWSTNVGVGVPGVELLKAAAAPAGSPATNRELGASTAAWHRQFSSPTTLLRDAQLVIDVAPTSALLPSEPFPVGGRDVTLEIRVDRLHKNEGNVLWSAPVVTYPYKHEAEGWKRLQIPIDLQSEQSFSKDQYLRLRVTCANTNVENCNLAYDHTTHDSALVVRLK